MTDATKEINAEKILPEMRERLLTNSTGKLTVSQWTDIVTQPIVSLLILLVPLTFIIPRLIWGFGVWMIGFLLLILIGVILMRAFRYARLPVQFEKMQAEADSAPFWMIWRGSVLADDAGKQMRFNSRLAPPPRLKRQTTYDVFYLRDNDRLILLSIAPANHPDAKRWQPTKAFETRLKRRKG